MYKNVFKLNDKIYSITDNGNEIVDFKPTIFVSSSKDKSDPWKTMQNETVYPIQPGSMKDTDSFIEQYKHTTGITVNGFTNYVSQYISEQFPEDIDWDIEKLNIVAIDIETTAELVPGFEEIGSFPNWRNPVQEILLITLTDFKTKKSITFGSKPYTGSANYVLCDNEKDLLIKFLEHWKSDYPDIITGWNDNTFDMPYVYHRMVKILGKDLSNQLSPFGICKPCPPRSPAAKAFIKEGEDRNICVRLFGISNLDYMELFKKYGRGTYESYKLDHIAQEVLGHSKLNHDEFEQFKDFYLGNPTPDENGNEIQQLAFTRNSKEIGSDEWCMIDNQIKQLSWNKFVDYNVIDAELMIDFEDKLNLIALVISTAYEVKINFEDTYSPVATWETLIFNYLKESKQTLPLPKHQQKKEQFAGAFVKEPKVGKHKWIASFDLNSLYPHEAMQFNISPDTITDVKLDIDVDYLLARKPLPDNGLAISATGWCYRKDKQGVIPALMERYYTKRKVVKKQMLAWQQEYEHDKSKELAKKISIASVKEQAYKISLLNSGYGALGEGSFLFFDVRFAESITYGGKLSILWAAQAVNKCLNNTLKTENIDFVVYTDTDSLYVSLDKVVESSPVKDKPTEDVINFMDMFCDKVIYPAIKESYVEMAEYTHSYQNKMEMARESLASVGIFHKKKKYVLSVWDSEGVRYATPKKKVIGLELVRSSTPAIVKKEMYKLLDIVLDGTEVQLQKEVTGFKEKFMTLPIEEISIPTGVNGVSSYSGGSSSIYIQGTPINSRAALLHNHYLAELNLEHKYEKISEGTKIKFVYLNKRNPTKENVIGFQGKLPIEFNLHQYVDKELMFEKAFLNACNILVEPLGWNAEEQSSLEEFFS